jgi:hypothetical protein
MLELAHRKTSPSARISMKLATFSLVEKENVARRSAEGPAGYVFAVAHAPPGTDAQAERPHGRRAKPGL